MADQIYQVIKGLKNNSEYYIETVLDGSCAGQKAIYKDGSVYWRNDDSLFFKERKLPDIPHASCQIYEDQGVRVFREILGSEKKLVICGGGHVSIPVIRLGKMLGFNVAVLEDRLEFAENAKKAGADRIICKDFEEGLKEVEGDNNTYYVIVTRGHRSDLTCLDKVCEKPYAYIGMIGSLQHARVVISALREKGTDPRILDDVHCPIGLAIGSETPEEIGISIMAEIIQVKNSIKKDGGLTKPVMKAILSEDTRDKVLATIISRAGSAPRDVGTKMLIREDKSYVGTIGGGLLEAMVIEKAAQILKGKSRFPVIMKMEMHNDKAAEAGMVCGGEVEILFEIV